MKKSLYCTVAISICLLFALFILYLFLIHILAPASYAIEFDITEEGEMIYRLNDGTLLTDTEPSVFQNEKTQPQIVSDKTADPTEPPSSDHEKIKLPSSAHEKTEPPSADHEKTEAPSFTVQVRMDTDTAFEMKDGKLVCRLKDGTCLKNGAVGTFLFDENGYYTSGDGDLDARIADIVAKQTTEKMEPLEKLKALYRFMVEKCAYRMGELHEVGEEGWQADDARMMIDKKFRGNCYGYAGLFRELARAVGFPAEAYSGLVRGAEGGKTAHGWVEIVIDGKTFYFDPEIQYFNNEEDMYMMDTRAALKWGYTRDPE